jgi:hypothetical protein
MKQPYTEVRKAGCDGNKGTGMHADALDPQRDGNARILMREYYTRKWQALS